MSAGEAKDPLNEWKNISNEGKTATAGNNSKSGSGEPIVKKRVPKKFREIPEYYFLPRMSKPKAILFYGSFIVAGVGAGMLLEGWINKKVKEDGGGVIWEFGK